MIESLQNKMVKKIISLHLKKEREKQNLFIVEGLRFVSEIPDDWGIEFFGISETFRSNNDIHCFEKKAKTVVFSDSIFRRMSETENAQGILAVCHYKKYELNKILEKKNENGFYVLVDQLNDPGNLGTIIRTADAGGVNALFLSKGNVDLYNSKVLRSTMGSVFHIPIFYDCDLITIIDILHAYKVLVLAAHLNGSQFPYSFDLTKPCGFVIGNEANGLTEAVAKACDGYVKLPMIGQAESLNASVAAGVLIYETVRQRLIK